MPRFIISTSNKPPIMVEAPNWLVAMGTGIARLADANTIDRLACETLPNGTVIARDARRGTAFIIREEATDDLLPDEATMEVEEDDIPVGDSGDELFVMGEDDEDDPTDPYDLKAAVAGILDMDEGDTEVVERMDSILNAAEVDGAWRAALSLAGELVPCEAGSALQITDRQSLRFISAFGPASEQLLEKEIPPGKGIVGFCARHRVGLIIQDAPADQRHYSAIDDAIGFNTGSVLCAPVALEAARYGCLELLNASEDVSFDRAQLELVSMIADSLAERLAHG